MMEINEIIDLYNKRKDEKEALYKSFVSGDRPFMIVQQPGGDICSECNDIKSVYKNNIALFEKWVQADYTDDLPFMEPWIGVGVYANAFGCDYLWRKGEAPATHYAYHKIDEIRNLEYPDWEKSSIMKMVLDAIEYMKEQTKSSLPISITDTQSPYDTATLILDASEFFMACYMEEETVHNFMGLITDMVIDFTRRQLDLIGPRCAARPGHLMINSINGKGTSISDDNLAVSSPGVNEKIAFPYNQKIADAFGGLAIHSCGKWEHTMAMLDKIKGVTMIDCAAYKDTVDPNPNSPELIRRAMKGKDIITKVRVGMDIPEILKLLPELVHPEQKIVLQIWRDKEKAEDNYNTLYDALSRLYEK